MSAESFSSEEMSGFTDQLETAIAMAVRETENLKIAKRIGAALFGEVYQPMTQEEERALVDQRTAINLSYIQGNVVSAEDKIIANDDAGRARKSALIRELLEASGKDDAYFAKMFAERYAIAQALAEELDVPLSQIYANDKTYNEVYRRWQTPDEYMQEAAEVVSHITGDIMQAALARHIERFIPPEQLKDLTSEELDEIAMKLQLNSEFASILRQAAEAQAEAYRQTVMYQFLKIYGIQALIDLDENLRNVVAPKKPWVREVFAEFIDE